MILYSLENIMLQWVFTQIDTEESCSLKLFAFTFRRKFSYEDNVSLRIIINSGGTMGI